MASLQCWHAYLISKCENTRPSSSPQPPHPCFNAIWWGAFPHLLIIASPLNVHCPHPHSKHEQFKLRFPTCLPLVWHSHGGHSALHIVQTVCRSSTLSTRFQHFVWPPQMQVCLVVPLRLHCLAFGAGEILRRAIMNALCGSSTRRFFLEKIWKADEGC